MRIWFIHPKYYDRKGVQAQWNEGLILLNIIYGRKNKLTIEKQEKSKSRSSQKVEEESSPRKSKTKSSKSNSKPGWINHPHSKRVTRYHVNLQKYIINTYLYYLREYGVKRYNINFNLEYLDMEFVDPFLRIPIHYYQIRKDQIDVWEKMKARDPNKFDAYKDYTLPSQYTLAEPFYYEENFDTYLLYLSNEYLEWSANNFQKLVGTEIPIDDVMNENHASNISQQISEDESEVSYSEPEEQSQISQKYSEINPLIHYEMLDSIWVNDSFTKRREISTKKSS